MGRIVAMCLLYWILISVTGCAVIAAIMGTTPATVDHPPIQQIINFLSTIPGIGTAVAAGLGVARWGWVEVAHAKLIKEGKKDDNGNGVDDALEGKPPATPTT